MIRPLPLLRPVLWGIAAVFLARGMAGVPVTLLASGPYAQELRSRLTFMVCTSLVCVVLGVSYALGAWHATADAGTPTVTGTTH